MFHYLYTNDMRIDNLEETAISFANMFLTDSLPSATPENKSLINNGMTVGYYLNLKNKGSSAKLVSNGKFRIVILNIIKKFQYPNPRTKESFINTKDDGINVAPLREVIKILSLAKLAGFNDFYLEKSELENFIFFNKKVAKSENGVFDRYSLISDILLYRESQSYPDYIAPEKDRNWKHRDRQLNELIAILKWSGFIKYDHERIYLKDDSELSKDLKSEIYEIINFNKFWDYNEVLNEERIDIIQKSYFEYIDDGLDAYLQNNISDNTNNYLTLNTLQQRNTIPLPKPFLLLAGVSGTGKSHFVRKQAEQTGEYQLVAVRPDWHEPSDLLGYVSRLSGIAQYVITDVLKFIVKAWQAVEKKCKFENIGTEKPKWVVKSNSSNLNTIPPYWLCLDEMNLAPVEQYFADYLSVLETREWVWDENKENFSYKTAPLLSPTAWENTNFEKQLKDLGVTQELIDFFNTYGIGIPFNLIVAGTVNMDETTHSFSRKVLDRAFSFDFSEFYPNDFDEFMLPDSEKTHPKYLSYPIYSVAEECKYWIESKDFLKALNDKLDNTPFKLGYRALNELLLSVISFQPQNESELQAVWDDFVMTKVLPRIEGDEVKLRLKSNDDSILSDVKFVLETYLKDIWKDGDDVRADLWREKKGVEIVKVKCRSKQKIERMIEQLKAGMVSFW